MDIYQTIGTVFVVLAGGLLQGTVAFGFGLLSVPLLLMIGFPLPVVLAISSVCTAMQAANGVHHLRQDVPWRDIGISVAIRGMAMLLGVWALRTLVKYPIDQVKFWIGLIMLLMVILQTVWQPRPRARLHGGWNLAAFLASGFTGGLCSMGGPPLVLWIMAHDWTAERTRAFLFASFLCLVPLQLILLYLAFGEEILYGMLWGAALSPVVLVASLLGLRIGARFSKPLLRQLAFLLLVLIALNAMSPQVWQWLRK